MAECLRLTPNFSRTVFRTLGVVLHQTLCAYLGLGFLVAALFCASVVLYGWTELCQIPVLMFVTVPLLFYMIQQFCRELSVRLKSRSLAGAVLAALSVVSGLLFGMVVNGIRI